MKIRERNKLLNRLCGNCAYAEHIYYENMVACEYPKVAKPHQNERNWYRKNKGGCVFWKESDVSHDKN